MMLLFVVYFIIVNLSGKRYQYFLPTFNFIYPNSYEEADKVAFITNKRDVEDVKHYHVTQMQH